MRDAMLRESLALMMRFAERTGLVGARPPRRYLWTDAFAVCNLLGLARATGSDEPRDLALRLVGQVHHELGRHRADDVRRGWISGLGEEEGEAHPTCGGLRIGKPRPERRSDEPLDAEAEWGRDGQYFHYLTKWMHALDQVARFTGEARYGRWARELAVAAHRAFVRGGGRGRHVAWKLSIDLSRPLVPSSGHHDPLDGFVLCRRLEATAVQLEDRSEPRLDGPALDYSRMLAAVDLSTNDSLGLGGLLTDVHALATLRSEPRLVSHLVAAAAVGLDAYIARGELHLPAHQRLPFRELGLAIGLSALAIVDDDALRQELDDAGRAALKRLELHRSLGRLIETFWRRPDNQAATSWREHEDINDVMLATLLAPEGY